MIRIAVRVHRRQAELVLAELLELVPGGVEEVDVAPEISVHVAPRLVEICHCTVGGGEPDPRAVKWTRAPARTVLLEG